MAGLRIERVDPARVATADDEAYAAALALRDAVFVREQGVSEALEFDGLDDDAEHFIAWRTAAESEPVVVGVARLRRVGGALKVERVAVHAAEREQGVGTAIMHSLEQRAQVLGAREITLHAQCSVIPFYEKLGYDAAGPIFEEAGIEHRSMRKQLGGAQSTEPR